MARPALTALAAWTAQAVATAIAPPTEEPPAAAPVPPPPRFQEEPLPAPLPGCSSAELAQWYVTAWDPATPEVDAASALGQVLRYTHPSAQWVMLVVDDTLWRAHLPDGDPAPPRRGAPRPAFAPDAQRGRSG